MKSDLNIDYAVSLYVCVSIIKSCLIRNRKVENLIIKNDKHKHTLCTNVYAAQ